MPGLSWWVAFSTADKGSQLRDGTPHDSPHLCIAGSNVNTYNLDALAFPSHFAHMQLGHFLKNQNGNLIDDKLLCIPGQGKATSLRRSILNNYSKCMQWLLYKILRSGLCAEICCNGGKKGLSGRIGTFSGSFQGHFGTLFVIFIIMLRAVIKKTVFLRSG